MIDNRNLILAIVLSLVILIGFEYYIGAPQREQLLEQQAQTETTQETATPTPQPGQADAPLPPGAVATAAGSSGLDREEALGRSPRVAIESPTMTGSISLTGARIDDLVLTRYRETIDPESPEIVLFSPAGTARPYFADFGWTAADRDIELPGSETLWQADGRTLRPGSPVTLTWTNGQGVRFGLVLELDENYLFTVTQTIDNGADTSLTAAPYGLISRTGHPDILGFYILHEGLIGVFDGTLDEIDYDDVEEEDDGVIQRTTTGGWLGITDKYWQAVLIPDQAQSVATRFVHTPIDNAGLGKYQADFLYGGGEVGPGATASVTSRLFAGAKVVEVIDDYQERHSIPLFDRSVDFGWFYYLTKPFFYALHYFAGILGNFGLAILMVTVIIKIVFFPLANKSYRAMAKMKKLQPEMKELQERFKDDRQRLQQEMMALYKKEGANPMSGCLPILVQIPVFFALYKVLFVTIEMRHTPFFGWIQDLSAPDPTTIINLFGLMPWGAPDLGILNLINIGVWPILMGITMVLQHRLNPQPTDPIQAQIFFYMPIVFTFLLAQFPAGLVIYWTWNNLLSILQQMTIMRMAGVPIGRGPKKPKSE